MPNELLILLKWINEIVPLVTIGLYSWLLVSVTFGFYIAVMHLKKVRGKLKKEGKDLPKPLIVILLPFTLIGAAFYLTLNVTLGVVIFWQPPNSLQFTSRCERNMAEYPPNHWRHKRAVWWCELLDLFEEDGHCKKVKK